MPLLKSLLNSCLQQFGYSFVRLRDDPFCDQQRLVPGGPITIFDVGANQGNVAATYRRLFPHATIHCFEPGEAAFRSLTERFAGDDHLHAHQLAVSDVCGLRTFHVQQKSTNSSLLPVSTTCGNFLSAHHVENVARVEVYSTKLDDYCEKEGLARVEVLKMDIQGCEAMALRGANRLLQCSAIDVIYTEVLFGSMYENQGSFHDLCALLSNHGYRLYRLYHLAYNQAGMLGYGDAIFVSPQVADEMFRGLNRRAA